MVVGLNLEIYPKPPNMSALEIISLSITSEYLDIDSENLLWSKIKKDYPKKFPNLIHRTQNTAGRKVYIRGLFSARISGVNKYPPIKILLLLAPFLF